jgi:hypothetical protein
MRAFPQRLTAIQPGDKIMTSFRFAPRGWLSNYVTSFRLQAEFIVNPNYHESQYFNYRGRDDVLPPYCSIHNLFFDIPYRQ